MYIYIYTYIHITITITIAITIAIAITILITITTTITITLTNIYIYISTYVDMHRLLAQKKHLQLIYRDGRPESASKFWTSGTLWDNVFSSLGKITMFTMFN